MRILDRQRYWAFIKAYVICFTALVGLYVVIDAFSNFDEFTKRASGASELALVMGRYYLIHMSESYDRLCGVIGMMAAIFTVTWVQKNNELLAILAAGVSTQRVIRPVIIASILVSGMAVVNQELIMPRYAEELQKPHDDDGAREIRVAGRDDSNAIYIHGNNADRRTRTVIPFNATIPVEIFGALREIEARQATYIPPTDRLSPQRGGWLLRGARLSPPLEPEHQGNTILIKLKDCKGFPPPPDALARLDGDSYFLRSDLTFQALTRRRQWYQYAPTIELIRGLTDPSNDPERSEIAVFLHNRLLRPLLALALLLLSLPQVLGGYGRNMFVNLGLSLGTAAVFYGVCFMVKYLGEHSVLSPELSAWAPLIGFGTLAAFRWDSIRT
ncbi:MAG: hypothetical protein NVSMB9_04300 [Isosphaeraceae bacterium]